MAEKVVGVELVCDHQVKALRLLLPLLSAYQREALFADVTEGYCKECGTNNLPCHCWNDE